MVQENDAIAIIVILYVSIGILFGICFCRLRRTVGIDSVTSSYSTTSGNDYDVERGEPEAAGRGQSPHPSAPMSGIRTNTTPIPHGIPARERGGRVRRSRIPPRDRGDRLHTVGVHSSGVSDMAGPPSLQGEDGFDLAPDQEEGFNTAPTGEDDGFDVLPDRAGGPRGENSLGGDGSGSSQSGFNIVR